MPASSCLYARSHASHAGKMSRTSHLNRSGMSPRFRLRTGGASPGRVSEAIPQLYRPARGYQISSRARRYSLGGVMSERRGGFGPMCEKVSTAATRWTGSTSALITATTIIAVWLLSGPLFHYSDTWQLVINTGTTIITFLMVFLIQRSQNKESMAVQLKLNEIVAAIEGASNRLIDVEDLTEEELRALHRHYAKLVSMARKEESLQQSHSIDEAEHQHELKKDIEESIEETVTKK